MIVPPTFEIKIAVIGPVSAGKSTFINALLVGKYSEMALQRTTAGVNFFRLNPGASSDSPAELSAGSTGESSPGWSMVADHHDTEDEILDQICKDNKLLREQKEVVERTFDIEDVNLCECRHDTKLVVVDIPGINEAESSSKYREYVAKKWDTYDCVIVIMDARHGVNSEEQVGLLDFIKKNLKDRKNLPVIVLFNKVDDIEFTEKDYILDEARAKVSSMFDIPSDRNLAADIDSDAFRDGLEDLKNSEGLFMPIFLPLSARNAYIYRLASNVDSVRFKRLEQQLVEVIGREQIGLRQWNKLSPEQRYDLAFEAISDPEVYEEGLKSSNFSTLEMILSYCVGGESTQTEHLLNQIYIATKNIKWKGLVQEIGKLWLEMKTLTGEDNELLPDCLKEAFWRVIESHVPTDDYADLLKEICGGELNAKDSMNVLKVLIEYHELVGGRSDAKEHERVVAKAVHFLNFTINNFLDIRWGLIDNDFEKVSTIAILGQIISLSSNQYFVNYLGELRHILRIEEQRFLHYLILQVSPAGGCKSKFSVYSDTTGKWYFKRGSSLEKIPQFPESYITRAFRLFCEWMERVDAVDALN